MPAKKRLIVELSQEEVVDAVLLAVEKKLVDMYDRGKEYPVSITLVAEVNNDKSVGAINAMIELESEKK